MMDSTTSENQDVTEKRTYVPPASYSESMNSDHVNEETKPSSSPETNCSNPSLFIEIADAMSEKDRVLFTVHTKSTLPEYPSEDLSVTRSHEDFVWLHDQFEENAEYAGFIIPPCPPKPDFEQSREKLMKLTEADGNLTEEEVAKMKSELEAEYLATFKKTVAMHDVFLKRLAGHPSLRDSYNLRIFLQYEQDLNVKLKSRRQQFTGYLQRSMSDHLSLVVTTATTHTTNVDQFDDDDELKQTRESLTQYYNSLKDVLQHADKMTASRKALSSQMILVHTALQSLHSIDIPDLAKMYDIMEDLYEKMRKTESRISSDDDLKLSDTLRYYCHDSQAAIALLLRRLRALQEYAVANKNLEKARSREKDVPTTEKTQQMAHEKAKVITDSARAELRDFRSRRINYFKRQLADLAEMEIKNNMNQLQILRSALSAIKAHSI